MMSLFASGRFKQLLGVSTCSTLVALATGCVTASTPTVGECSGSLHATGSTGWLRIEGPPSSFSFENYDPFSEQASAKEQGIWFSDSEGSLQFCQLKAGKPDQCNQKEVFYYERAGDSWVESDTTIIVSCVRN